MQLLADYRSKAAGLPDLTNYAALVDEGVVLGKDGSLIAGFYFRGNDFACASDANQNYLTALVNTYLCQFGSGWAAWIDAVRFPSPGYPAPELSHFPDPISAMIDAERREMFEQSGAHFESRYALILQYLPPHATYSRIAGAIYSDSGDVVCLADKIIAGFKKTMDGLQSGLGDILHLRRMGTVTAGPEDEQYESDELVNYLHFCITGDTIALKIPPCPMYLDSWLGFERLWPGEMPKIGDKFIATITIDGFPSDSYPGILSFLEDLPIPYRWSTRYVFMDPQEAIAFIDAYRRKWKQKIRGFVSELVKAGSSVVNMDAAKKTQEAADAMSSAESGVVSYGYYTPAIILLHQDDKYLEELARYVKKEIEHRGFKARIETVNAVESWIGAMPGHAHMNIRRVGINTLNLADLLPLSGVWAGLEKNPCSFYPDNSPPLIQAITTGSTPFRLNYHVSDVGHTLIFGPTGAGKSTLLATGAVQFLRYRSRPRPDGTTVPATVTAFDKGHSLYALCSAVGGIHHDIGADDSTLSLCPLAELDTVSDLIWAQQWLEICFELRAGKNFSPRQSKLVHEALELMQRTDKEFRTMTEFVSSVQDPEIHDALAHYSIGGGLGSLLDGSGDSIGESSFTVFEIGELMSLGPSNAIPVLLYLFRRFEKSLTGQPALLSLDEAWVMLGHKVFREKIREWLKELRKKNCAVIIATQSLSDAVNSGLMDVLVEQCPTKILLPNAEADQRGTKELPGPADLYAMFGLTDKEILMLKGAQYKRQYYYRSPLGRRMFELGIGPLALSFVGVSDRDSLREVRAYQKEYGADWPLHWLQKNGVDYEKYIV